MSEQQQQHNLKKPVLIRPIPERKVVKKLKLEESQGQEEESEQQDAFLSFVNSYAMFINDSQNVILDLDVVIQRLNDAIVKFKPPQKTDPTLEQFHQQLSIQPESVSQLAQQLKQLPDQKLYSCIQNIEKLNVKLLLDYNMEVKKGKSLNIIKNDQQQQ